MPPLTVLLMSQHQLSRSHRKNSCSHHDWVLATQNCTCKWLARLPSKAYYSADFSSILSGFYPLVHHTFSRIVCVTYDEHHDGTFRDLVQGPRLAQFGHVKRLTVASSFLL
jgi:hypothetical protein